MGELTVTNIVFPRRRPFYMRSIIRIIQKRTEFGTGLTIGQITLALRVLCGAL